MLLAIDIGNSNVSLGIFEGHTLVARSSISALGERSSDEYAAILYNLLQINQIETNRITDCILSSVVPTLTGPIEDAVRRLTSVLPVHVGPGIRTGFKIQIDDPSQLGGDLVADTVAALTEYHSPIVLIDAGTVTTIAAINSRRVYLGGCILPGIRSSAKAMKASTALLPTISLRDSVQNVCLGKNTEDAMRCGLLLGGGMMVDGFIDRYRALPLMQDAVCIATGGSAEMVLYGCKRKIILDPDLTLKGLMYLYAGQK